MEENTRKYKKRKCFMIIPYLVMPLITPLYNILDSKVFVEVFGCGCVPIAQTNMLNIPYNANDLRMAFYSILAILMTALGVFISKALGRKSDRIVYCASIFIINVVMMITIYKKFMWG